MKKTIVISILLLCSVFCLSSCGNTKQETNTKLEENVVNDKKSETVEKKKLNQSENIDYQWYKDRYYKGTKTEWLFFVNEQGDSLQFGLDTKQIAVVDKDNYEIIDSEEYGKVIRYYYVNKKDNNYECRIDYFINKDEVIIGLFQGDNEYTDVYTYYGEKSNKTTEEEPQNSNDDVSVSLIDGQRFECFETAQGEDVILTIHLYYTDDSNNPSVYKGELNNGVEFEFELCDTHKDEESYRIKCLDNSNAFLTYYPSRGEIELTAEDGTEYGNMYAYSGTYIGLPDSVEE